MNNYSAIIARAAAARVAGAIAIQQRDHLIKAIDKGNPLAGEPDERRKAARIKRAGAEIVQGPTVDFLNVSFLELARSRANAVARVIFRNGQAHGTGFMISDRLFVTNNHVIQTAAFAGGLLAEFDYELKLDGTPRAVTRFAFDPGAFFVTDDQDDLDYTVIAIGGRASGGKELAAFGRVPLSGSPDRHVIGEFVNIIQHPDGEPKKLALHENRIVTRLEHVLHYETDTLGGASGSPVFNLQCEVVALHHWGGPHRQTTDTDGQPVNRDVNEGVRISSILKELNEHLPALSTAKAALLRRAINGGGERVNPVSDAPVYEVSEPGVLTVTVPVKISVSIGAPLGRDVGVGGGGGGMAALPDVAPEGDEGGAEKSSPPDADYGNREGYNAKFLEGFPIPLPKLSKAQIKLAAINQKPSAGKDKWVLDYHHFSLAVNRVRKTAFFTATNIDGATWKSMNRETGVISEAPEAREKWYPEPRIGRDEQSNDDDYKPFAQFQRGHLVRRQYPDWGSDDDIRKADADTFHFVNCSLQHFNFNPKLDRWLGLEDWVLKNAHKNDVRVSVFTGPIFRDSDPQYGRLQAPVEFWIVAARVDGGVLDVRAFKASQEDLLKKDKEAVGVAGGEAFDPLPAKLQVWQASVAHIEKLSGLRFGMLKKHDSYVADGEGKVGQRLVKSEKDIHIKRPLPAKRGAKVPGGKGPKA